MSKKTPPQPAVPAHLKPLFETLTADIPSNTVIKKVDITAVRPDGRQIHVRMFYKPS